MANNRNNHILWHHIVKQFHYLSSKEVIFLSQFVGLSVCHHEYLKWQIFMHFWKRLALGVGRVRLDQEMAEQISE